MISDHDGSCSDGERYNNKKNSEKGADSDRRLLRRWHTWNELDHTA